MAAKPKNDTQVVPREDLSVQLNLFALSGEIGWKLALPLLTLMIIGIKLDRAYHTTPLFMMVGIALAFTVSIILIARMIIRINQPRGSK